jgi:hypothetical protein
MIDDNQQHALCEYLTRDFMAQAAALTEADQDYPGDHFKYDFPPAVVKEETRQWYDVRFCGFHKLYDPSSTKPTEWVGQISGARSDGQYFYQNVHWRPDEDKGDPEELLRSRFKEALAKFSSYRDCTCGFLGCKPTGEVDEDGDPVEIPVYSSCLKHPREPVNA